MNKHIVYLPSAFTRTAGHFEICACILNFYQCIVKLSDNDNLESISMDNRICMFALLLICIFDCFQYKNVKRLYNWLIFLKNNHPTEHHCWYTALMRINCRTKTFFVVRLFLEPRQNSIEFIRTFSAVFTLCLSLSSMFVIRDEGIDIYFKIL